MKTAILLIISLIGYPVASLNAQPIQLDLSQGWEFSEAGKNNWRPVHVPGTVHEELIINGELPHIYFAHAAEEARKIESKSWDYRLIFDLDSSLLKKRNIEITLQGLDTYADIYLNHHLLGSGDNMFRTWTYNIKPAVREKGNELRIRLHSAFSTAKKYYRKNSLELPAGNDNADIPVSPYVRKPPFHFGWDWGPRWVSAGLREIPAISAWEDARITEIRVRPKKVAADEAIYEFLVQVESDPEGNPLEIVLSLAENKGIKVKTPFLAQQGVNIVPIRLTIPNPELWWPRGYGASHLYHLNFTLKKQNQTLDSQSKRLGIRQVELIRKPDGIGESFYFKVNGKRIFAKGANYIPPSHLVHLSGWEIKQKTLQAALDANMNMIRIWGGGDYETDEFYQFCDENGLLVWQDFMFACSMYPGDKYFRETVSYEVSEQIRRLNWHPSLALWCGNNEMEVAWGNWGWQSQFKYSPADSARIYQDYLYLFDTLIPGQIQVHSPEIPWLSSSPSSNWGKIENFDRGNMHYWGVWHGMDSLEAYRKFIPRFMSEYGFQSWPEQRLLSPYHAWDELNFENESFLSRQKSYKGNAPIDREMSRRFGIPDLYKEYAYLSQLIQKEAYTIAIRAHRSTQRCAGTLYWQLNDCWPGPSWASLDVHGNWKAAHYAVRDAYAPVIIYPEFDRGRLTLNGSSNLPMETEAGVRARVMNASGIIQHEAFFTLHFEPNESQTIQMDSLLAHIHPEEDFLVLDFPDNAEIPRAICFFTSPKKYELPCPEVRLKDISAGKTHVLEISSPELLRSVYLSVPQEKGYFSENYFDLLPGETKKIQFFGEIPENKQLSEYVSLTHLREVLNRIDYPVIGD